MLRWIKEKENIFQQLFFIMLDGISVFVASIMALWIRFDFSITKIDKIYLDNVWRTMPLNIIMVLAVYWLFRLYRSVWKYASWYELQRIILAGVTATLIQLLGLTLADIKMPRSYWFLYAGILVGATVCTRFAYRILRRIKSKWDDKKRGDLSRVMIVGAGSAADLLIREIKTSQYLHKEIGCIIDDNPELKGKSISGFPIVGGRNSIIEAASRYNIDEIIIAMPSVSRKETAEIATICNQTGCEIKMVPGMYQFVNNELRVSKLRHVEIEDLLGREPVKVDMKKVTAFVKNQTVLVTGGGGSIGSELCRQIAAAGPKKLIIVDIYENNAYEIQQELKRKYPKLNLIVLIASVRNTNRINKIFETYLPNIVFHAAAHKHVPLMEDSPNEAIKNNVFGTLKTVQAADKYGVERFVLISTDKAVNPTNIMGASKRICEMIVQAYSRRSKTQFVAVRFGNVLGSNGSVIPLFKKQIKEGGPVTVTHPDIIRYFMTIPEAVSLVLEAGAFAEGGEIFVLDMGEPVKIVDLAKNLIRLSGYVPNEDIMIEYTGLRPGEKLYEERLMEEEGLKTTENNRISVARPIEMDDIAFFDALMELKDAVYDETGSVREMVKDIVPTYKIPFGKK
ncbi:MAG: polysaccharide biosynthesis protein [Lachnospiraceae bacterium]|nr:polysaccharide biosynthesis protein [Lachnospiraceae bacterium]MBP3595243.1 polysaccharide biosynthesis protein [Lachnospiraceae bacterium]